MRAHHVVVIYVWDNVRVDVGSNAAYLVEILFHVLQLVERQARRVNHFIALLLRESARHGFVRVGVADFESTAA